MILTDRFRLRQEVLGRSGMDFPVVSEWTQMVLLGCCAQAFSRAIRIAAGVSTHSATVTHLLEPLSMYRISALAVQTVPSGEGFGMDFLRGTRIRTRCFRFFLFYNDCCSFQRKGARG
jgi:hypothetical protein